MMASFLGKAEKGEKDERNDNKHPAKKLEASNDIGLTPPGGRRDLLDRSKIFVHIGPPCPAFDTLPHIAD